MVIIRSRLGIMPILHILRCIKEDIVKKRQFKLMATGCLIIASLWVTPTLADMFYYRDAQGQLHLTNVWSRIPSAYRDQAARHRRPEQGGPTQTTGKLIKVPSTPSS